MNYWKIIAVSGLMLTASIASNAQACDSIDALSVERILADIRVLASDELGGREPGTPGMELAQRYITMQMRSKGIQPMGEEGYFQAFTYMAPVTIEAAALEIAGKPQDSKDFYSTSYSVAEASISGLLVDVGFGISAPELAYDDYAGLKKKQLSNTVYVMNIGSPDGIHPHSKYIAHHSLNERLALAQEHGAAAVLLVDPENATDAPSVQFKGMGQVQIPVFFVQGWTGEVFDWVKKPTATLMVRMHENEVTAKNIIGYLDRGAAKTVAVGAHYDHLGMGSEGSRHVGPPAVHNGADDNASGVAGMLEFAAKITDPAQDEPYNYLFMAFSAEEKGLLGSKHFVEHPTFPLEDIEFMINLDMIGHMENRSFTINGVGTSPQWLSNIEEVACDSFSYTTTESGIGPSDHTSFYLQKIPAIHLFTGAHEHYHKPSDDVGIINPEGIAYIVNFMQNLVGAMADDTIAFQETKAEESRKAPKFSVTLGVMPDYSFSGPGMRIDGVIDDRPAQAAGMLKGDVVKQLGDIRIDGMQGYMRALAAFKKGDRVKATIDRDGSELELEVQF